MQRGGPVPKMSRDLHHLYQYHSSGNNAQMVGMVQPGQITGKLLMDRRCQESQAKSLLGRAAEIPEYQNDVLGLGIVSGACSACETGK